MSTESVVSAGLKCPIDGCRVVFSAKIPDRGAVTCVPCGHSVCRVCFDAIDSTLTRKCFICHARYFASVNNVVLGTAGDTAETFNGLKGSQVKAADKEITCPVHVSNPLVAFCTSCRAGLCNDCSIEEHEAGGCDGGVMRFDADTCCNVLRTGVGCERTRLAGLIHGIVACEKIFSKLEAQFLHITTQTRQRFMTLVAEENLCIVQDENVLEQFDERVKCITKTLASTIDALTVSRDQFLSLCAACDAALERDDCAGLASVLTMAEKCGTHDDCLPWDVGCDICVGFRVVGRSVNFIRGRYKYSENAWPKLDIHGHFTSLKELQDGCGAELAEIVALRFDGVAQIKAAVIRFGGSRDWTAFAAQVTKHEAELEPHVAGRALVYMMECVCIAFSHGNRYKLPFVQMFEIVVHIGVRFAAIKEVSWGFLDSCRVLLEIHQQSTFAWSRFGTDSSIDLWHRVVKTICQVMDDHITDPRHQQKGCQILTFAIRTAEAVMQRAVGSCVFVNGCIRRVLSAMAAHTLDASVQEDGCYFLAYMTMTPDEIEIFKDTCLSLQVLEALYAAMDSFPGVSGVQLAASVTINNLLVYQENLMWFEMHGGQARIFKAMDAHVDNDMVQAAACKVLLHLSVRCSMAVEGGLEMLLRAMEHFPSDARLQEDCCNVLWNLASSPDVAFRIVRGGALPLIFAAFDTFEHFANVQKACCGLLCLLMEKVENCLTILRAGALDKLFTAMDNHLSEVSLQTNCIAIMRRQESRGRVIRLGGFTRIFAAMDEHLSMFPLQCTALRTLNSICEDQQSSRVIVREGGLTRIVAAMNSHRENLDVQRSACRLMRKLIQDKQHLPSVLDAGAIESVSNVLFYEGFDRVPLGILDELQSEVLRACITLVQDPACKSEMIRLRLHVKIRHWPYGNIIPSAHVETAAENLLNLLRTCETTTL